MLNIRLDIFFYHSVEKLKRNKYIQKINDTVLATTRYLTRVYTL